MSADVTVDDPDQLAGLYRNRFDTRRLADKQVLWSPLCEAMFQQDVRSPAQFWT
jgi:hypothetical protein